MPTHGSNGADRSTRSSGQIIVLFAGMIFTLVLLLAIVVDLSAYWAAALRVQRAADAAALAGAVYLPGNVAKAQLAAATEATKNGFTAGGGVTVTAVQDPASPRRLRVTIVAPVQTYFMRIIGINTLTANRDGRAEFVLPVPMGSPQNFYGVYCLTTPAKSSCDSTNAVPDASGSGTLPSQGFWGAIQSSGNKREQGDAFTPYNDPLNPKSNSYGGTNPNYDPNGYNYEVEVPAAGGAVYIFDPTFCAVTGGKGSGDHWNDNTNWSVTSYFKLYDMKGTPWDTTDDTLVANSGTLFERQYAIDKSNTWGTPPTSAATSNDGVAQQDCQVGASNNNPAQGRYWHHRWWTLASGLPAGTYRVNITSATVNVAPNWNASAENDWSIEVTGPSSGGNNPRVYGLGRMAGYNILANGVQTQYLAQIGAENAGKTMEIDLFDPGDVSGGATLRLLSPDGNAYNYATFSYSADNGQSGNNVTSIITNSGGTSYYNNAWLTILVPLPATYGCSVSSPCLTPSGEPGPGWWKLEYTVAGGNDTTTWMVSVRGNPVHLILP
jgi:hypothetical protein